MNWASSITYSAARQNMTTTSHMAAATGLLRVTNVTFATVLGIFIVLANVNRVFRADFLTVATEDAPEFIDLEDERVAIAVLVLSWHQLDAVGWTDARAQTTSDAPRLAVLLGEHPMRSAPTRRQLPSLLWVLDRDLGLEHVLQSAAHALSVAFR